MRGMFIYRFRPGPPTIDSQGVAYPVLPGLPTWEDVTRVGNARARVFRLMGDGEWHAADELREVGGAEGTRRVREMRAYGTVEVRPVQ